MKTLYLLITCAIATASVASAQTITGTQTYTGTNTITNTISSDVGSNLIFKSGSINTLETSGTYSNLKGNVTFEKGSTINVSDTLTISNGNWLIDGDFITTKPVSNSWQSIKITGANTKLTFGENATLSTEYPRGRIWVQNSTVIFNAAKGSIVADSLVLGKATLEFNKENSLRTHNNQNTMLNLMTGANTTIILKDTQNFGEVLFQGINQDASMGDDTSRADTLAKLTLDLQFKNANDYVSFDPIIATYTHADGTKQEYVNIYVKDFESHRILLTDNGYDYAETSINFIDAYTGKQIYYTLEATNVNGVNGYWVNAVGAIPEPAEWAAIFGALALALAVYRKRK